MSAKMHRLFSLYKTTQATTESPAHSTFRSDFINLRNCTRYEFC